MTEHKNKVGFDKRQTSERIGLLHWRSFHRSFTVTYAPCRKATLMRGQKVPHGSLTRTERSGRTSPQSLKPMARPPWCRLRTRTTVSVEEFDWNMITRSSPRYVCVYARDGHARVWLCYLAVGHRERKLSMSFPVHVLLYYFFKLMNDNDSRNACFSLFF